MPDLTFFGSTVDAIAPQEQNVLSQYRQHNWQVEAANAAAAERARQLSMAAWARAQENEQQQSQQNWANSVNLLQFANQNLRSREGEQRRQFEWETGRTDRASELAASNAVRLAQFGARSANAERDDFAKMQAAIMNGGVKSLDEAWAYVPKTPQNVDRITKLLATANKELVANQIEQLNAQTASIKAEKLAAALKTNPGLSPDGKKQTMLLAREELDLIPQMIGTIAPGIRWDSDKERWTNEPDTRKNFSPIMGEFRKSEDNLDLSRLSTKPAVIVPQVSNQGGGYNFPTPAPRVDLSQFRTGTNAPVVTSPAVIAPTATLTPALRATKLAEARRAISLGANPQQVAERLRQRYGIALE